MAIKYLKPTTLKHKSVLLRVDVNVPVEEGKIDDDFRIQRIVPTVKMLLRGGNKVIIGGHLGRPEGEWNAKYSLKPVAERLSSLLGFKFIETDYKFPDYQIPHLVFYEGKIVEERHQKQLAKAHPKDVVVLENLRFYKGEEKNDPVFARHLSRLAEVYVNEAFGVDHRAAASTVGITKYLTSYCGPLLEREIKSLDAVLRSPKKPFTVMMGGIKISDKVQTIENLSGRADRILVGGGLANLFFLAKGYEIGLSKVENDAIKLAWQLEKNLKDKIHLPTDVVVTNERMERDAIRVVPPFEVGKKEVILDCGPKTILEFSSYLKTAKTIVWNGPLGFFEKKPFHTATIALARVIGGVATRKAYAVVGGGETVDAVRQAGQLEHMDHVSTGGGAMLEYLAGKKLPGIEALK